MITISLFYYQQKVFKIFTVSYKMEDVTDADYAQAKRIYKDFEIKHLGEYLDLYVQSDTLQLSDVLENVRDMCL